MYSTQQFSLSKERFFFHVKILKMAARLHLYNAIILALSRLDKIFKNIRPKSF
jgi:hypothetical protein